MMIKSIFPFLFMCIVWSSGYGQCGVMACDNNIVLCQYGENIIGDFFNDGDYLISFSADINSSFSNPIDAVAEDYELRFTMIYGIPFSGIYQVECSNGNSCWGNYTLESCVDFIDFDECFDQLVYHCDNGSSYLPYTGRIHNVCLGDTSHAAIAALTYTNSVTSESRYEPFHPSRFECSFGSVVDYTDSSVSIVWTEVTEGCLGLTTTTMFASELKAAHYVAVHPVDSMSIYSDKGDSESATICSGEDIKVTLDTEYEVEPKWEVNGSVYYGFENTLSFDDPGEYNILISHQEKEECNCTPDAYYTVIVNSGDSPSIDCKRTVCVGEATTYYSGTECDSYIWDVGPSGVILEGGEIGDSYVTIEWTSGPTEEISLSTPACFETVCSETIVETINIINPSINIEGLDWVCVGEIATYIAPNYTGTNFDWAVSSHGEIINGQGTNRIQVRWNTVNDSDMGKVVVTYNNCNIDCGGYAELDVSILPELKIINLSNDLCLDTDYTFGNNLGVIGDWKLIEPNGFETTFSSLNTLLLNLTVPGEYTLELINPLSISCNTFAFLHFEVLEDIIPVAAIDGPQLICAGLLVKYTVPGLSSVESVSWQVIDGPGPPQDFGFSRSLFYTWTSNGPYQITVSIINNLTGCESESSIFLFDNDISLNGLSDLCLGEDAEYALPEYHGGQVTWSIDPPSAGTIIEANEEWVRIIWSEEGLHQVIASYCGLTLNRDVTIRSYPTAVLNFDDRICYNELATLDISTDASNSIALFNEANTLISTSTNTNIPFGSYTLDLSSPFGCTTTENIKIEEIEEYQIEINTLSSKAVCPPFNAFEIFAVEVSSNYTYQWYKDNAPVGGNSPSYFVTEIGIYHLVVTDENGCKATSNALNIYVCCITANGPYIPPVDMEVTEINCNVRDFEMLTPYQSTNFNWNFGDPFGSSNTASGFAVSHTYSRAGRYTVLAEGNALCETYEVDFCGDIMNQTDCEGTSTVVEIPLATDFSFEIYCDADPVVFIDETTFLPSVGALTHAWDFGDPASADNTSTDATPTHIFSSAGTYSVTLSVTEVGVCTSTKTKEVFIEERPSVSINSQAEYCIGVLASFESITAEEDLDYLWDFGDPGSGVLNNSTEKNAEHMFSSFGTFTVELVVTDSRGCSSSVTKMIELVDNQMQGNITSDISIPKCPTDLVTLSAPLGGETYLWSTGETTPSIEVIAESEYKVTITNAIGCVYFPAPFQVYNFDVSDIRIYSLKESEIAYDSIDVCIGDNFDLYATEYLDATYSWDPVSVGNSTLDYFGNFNSLTSGRYTYSVTVTDHTTGCMAFAGPFIINLHEELVKPVIVSENGNYCENSPITLSVNPYDPSLRYEWNNGLFGESITVYSSGEYDVTVTNDVGCSKISEGFKVRPSPGTNEWMTGCIEVCFPEDFCLNLNDDNTYELIHNGTNIGLITNNLNTSDLTLTEPGDYELLVTNQYGCQSMSDILTLTASPNDQALSGIVYLDENANSIFDGDDVLQDDVVVYLMNGNTIIDSTITDDIGFYSFDPITQSNLRVVLALASIDFSFEGVSDSTLIYNECIEDKEVDFPLVSLCTNPLHVDTFYTCATEPILIHGILYNANDIDTTVVHLDALCDSTYIVHVRAFEEPEISLDIFPSCISNSNGALFVNSLYGDNLEYSLTPDFSIIDSVYSDLEPGVFTLYVRDVQGCLYLYPFTIDEVEEPEFVLIGGNTCKGESSGEFEIDVLAGDNLQFSLGVNADFTDQLIYDNLEEGEYQVYVKDSFGCIYSDEIIIESFISPQINIINGTLCEGDIYGTMSVEVLEGNPTFSIDGSGTFSYDTVWSSLTAGPHVLYVESQYGCLDSFNFHIELLVSPELDIAVIDECENLNLGAVEIISDDESLEFSLDGISFSYQLFFENLSVDNYILYTRIPEGCIFEQTFSIEHNMEPQLTLSTQQTCINGMNGVLDIASSAPGELQFAINGSDFYNYSKFENLEKGDYMLSVQIVGSACEYQYPFTIEEAPVPKIEIIENNTCHGTSTGTLDIQIISGSGLTFNIDGSEEFNSETLIDNLAEGEYMLTVLDEFGCSYGYPASIGVLPEPDFTVEIINTCDNLDNGSLIILSNDADVLTSINGSSFSHTMRYDDLAKGLYEVAILNSHQCLKNQIVELSSNPPLEVGLEDYSLDCYDTELEIKPIVSSHHGELHYQWNTEESSESILARTSGSYEVTISDFCDEQYLSTEIQISHFNEANLFYVANIFSPNEDNINDCFHAVVDPSNNIISFTISVFDRWGNLLFSADDQNECWDGRFQNIDVVPGVYVYVVNVEVDHCDGIKEVKKMGDVTVVR